MMLNERKQVLDKQSKASWRCRPIYVVFLLGQARSSDLGTEVGELSRRELNKFTLAEGVDLAAEITRGLGKAE